MRAKESRELSRHMHTVEELQKSLTPAFDMAAQTHKATGDIPSEIMLFISGQQMAIIDVQQQINNLLIRVLEAESK